MRALKESMSLSSGDDYFWEPVLMAETERVFCSLRNDREAPI